jgi:hypothetical protein
VIPEVPITETTFVQKFRIDSVIDVLGVKMWRCGWWARESMGRFVVVVVGSVGLLKHREHDNLQHPGKDYYHVFPLPVVQVPG